MFRRAFSRTASEQSQKLVIYGVGQAFNLITPLLVIPYIVSICGEEGYGKVGVGMAFSFFLIVLIDYGCDIVGVREIAVNRDDSTKLNQIVSTTYAAKFVLLVVTLLMVSILYHIVPYFAAEKQLFLLGLPILVGQFLNPTWFLQGVENFKAITFVNITSKMIYLIGVYLVVQQPDDYIYINLLWGIGMIIPNAIVLAYVFISYHFSVANTSKADVTALLRNNFSMFSSQIFVSLQLYAPIIMISIFGNHAMAGMYKIVEQIIVIFKTYIFLFFNYVFSRICYLLDKDFNDGIRYWSLFNGANFLFIGASMAFLYIFAWDVVAYFNPDNIGKIVYILSVAVLIPMLLSISIPLKQLVLAWNFNRSYIMTTMAMVALNLLLIVFLLPTMDIMGVIISALIAETLTIVLFFVVIKHRLLRR